jgi:HK97 family phage prohead protease
MTTWNYPLAIEKQWVVKQDGKQYHYISGYASDSSVDRDGDRMSPKALKSMQEAITAGMNLFTDHNHGIWDTIGLITKAENRGGYLWLEARLENPEINPKSAALLHKMEIGEKVGLSIGGDMVGSHWEEDKALGKKVRVIDDVKLYEVSVVGLPSNANAYLLGATYKSLGSLFIAKEVHKMSCGLCRNFHGVTEKLLKELDELHDEEDDSSPVKQDFPMSGRVGGSQGYHEEDEAVKALRDIALASIKAKALDSHNMTVGNTTLKHDNPNSEKN